MSEHEWVEGFPGAVTVCDDQGKIIEMNAKAVEAFAADGGAQLIGRNVLDCHPEPARTKLKGFMDNRQTNIYTIDKGGVRKLICQAPWYRHSEYAGFAELSFEVPRNIPNFKRD
jgi:PAS domain-containing protein